MRILLINRFFGGEQTPTGRMLLDVAEELCRLGHEVEVLVSKSSYTGKKAESEVAGGYKLREVREPGRNRVLQWGWFWLWSFFALASRRWDRCLILTDPPFLPFAAWLARPFRRGSQKVFWWTMDIYPEALVAAEMLREGSMANRFLRWLNDLGVGGMGGVVVLGPRQRARLDLYPSSRRTEIRVVSPWDHRRIELVDAAANPLVTKLGCGGKKIALYSGNLGEGHVWRPLHDAARKLAEDKREDWVFFFFIRGVGKAKLAEAAQDLPNVRIMDYLPEAETSNLLSLATVHLVTMQAGWEGVIVPSKLYATFQTKAPVLFIGPDDADTAVEIERWRRGACLPTDSSGAAVVRALDALAMRRNSLAPVMDKQGPARIAAFVCGALETETPANEPAATR